MLAYTHAIFRGLQEELRLSLAQLPLSTPSVVSRRQTLYTNAHTSLYTPSVLRNGLLDAHRKFSDYYYKLDQSPYYTWAALFDPRISYGGLKANFWYDDEPILHLDHAKIALDDPFREHYANRAVPAVPAHTNTASSSSVNQSGSPQQDFVARYRQTFRGGANRH
ncbi:hypothetical protein DFH09DRAFT_1308966 [Mycena vulgaris]|nr:hypothetical protein DFH09DRAFT_1308966 [Mycena vulgaris]